MALLLRLVWCIHRKINKLRKRSYPVGCSVGWGSRIHWLLLCKGLIPGYDTKRSDGKVSLILELWECGVPSSFPSLPGPLWPGVVAPDRVLSMGQIELNCVLMLNGIVWNRTLLTFNRTVLTLNCLSTKTILLVNWIIWNLIPC